MLKRLKAVLLCAALITATGCHSLAPRPNAQADATLAASAAEPIVFRPDPGALDTTDFAEGSLTLNEAIRLALKNDPRVQAALSRVRISEAEADQAELLPNPVIDIALRFPTEGGKPIIDAGLAAELISVLQRPGKMRATDARLRGSAAAAVTSVIDVVSDVREKYVAIQSLDKLLAVFGERREIIIRLLDLARARLEAGEATELDVTTVETQVLELETDVADKELEIREDRLSLSRLIGQPSGQATWSLTKWEPVPESVRSEREWVALALAHRPELEEKRFELSALGAERSLTRFAPFDKADTGVTSERDSGWSVGPQVSFPFPLFDMGQATRARATAAVIEAGHKLQEAEREAVEETRRAYASFIQSKANLSRIKDRLMPLQERRLAQAEAQYKAGQTEITSLFLAEQDLRGTKAKLIELERRTTESLIRLEKSVGGPGVALRKSSSTSATDPPTK